MARSRRIERRLSLALAVAVLGAPALGADLQFARRGEPVASRNLETLRSALSSANVRVHEPYENGEVVFAALRLPDVLDVVYGESWRDEEELLLTCRDGYQPTVPVARVLAHRAWLAFDRADQEGFTIRKPESGTVKTVALGPFYLVWENLDDTLVRQEHDYGWPYQLVGIDLIRTSDRFPKMAPPAGAPDEAVAGFVAFRVHCSKCHRLNGEGGTIGPELVGPASPVEHRDPDWLRAWIVDPGKMRPGTRMPPLNPALPERERIVNEILAYLRAMLSARNAAGAS